jgi:hypothetical protein
VRVHLSTYGNIVIHNVVPHTGMARRMGTETQKSWALSHIHIACARKKVVRRNRCSHIVSTKEDTQPVEVKRHALISVANIFDVSSREGFQKIVYCTSRESSLPSSRKMSKE